MPVISVGAQLWLSAIHSGTGEGLKKLQEKPHS
jgi:hypothetical protein